MERRKNEGISRGKKLHIKEAIPHIGIQLLEIDSSNWHYSKKKNENFHSSRKSLSRI